MKDDFNSKLKQLYNYDNVQFIYKFAALIDHYSPMHLCDIPKSMIKTLYQHKHLIIKNSNSAYNFLICTVLNSTQDQLVDYIKYIVKNNYLDNLTNIVLILSTEIKTDKLQDFYNQLLEYME